jgi:hypothetical protein
MRRLLSLLLLVACAKPVYYQNFSHPERDFDMDKYDCEAIAQARASAVYPVVTLQNMGMYNMFEENYYLGCLSSRGWVRVEK